MYEEREKSKLFKPMARHLQPCATTSLYCPTDCYDEKLASLEYVYSYRTKKGEKVDKTRSRAFDRTRFALSGIDEYRVYCQMNLPPAVRASVTRAAEIDWLNRPGGSYPTLGRLVNASAMFNDDTLLWKNRDKVLAGLFAEASAPVFDGLMFAGGILDLLDLIKQGLQHLFDVIKSAETFLKAITSPHETWLWYRYVFMTTMLDITEAISAYNGKDEVIRVSGFNEEEWTDVYYSGVNLIGYNIFWRITDTIQLRTGAQVVYDCHHDPNPFGFGPQDLVRTIWDKIPFSFVIDWFIGIGEWLQSLRPIETAIADQYVTSVLNRNVAISFDPARSPGWVQSGGGSDIVIKGYRTKRSLDATPPALPVVNVNVSMFRKIDALALLVGFIQSWLKKGK